MQFLETDVLVIGGGGAGAMSTLHAHNQGVKVILVVKGKFGPNRRDDLCHGGGYGRRSLA